MVAPFEADAKLSYPSWEGFADLVISEDSDLLVFGCKQVYAFPSWSYIFGVLFKFGVKGHGFFLLL